MPSSTARTQGSTLFELERQLEEALAPFASDTRNLLPDEPTSRWVATSNREANPTISRRPRQRRHPGFSHVEIRPFFPLLLVGTSLVVAPFEKSSARGGRNLDKVISWQALHGSWRALGKERKVTGYRLEGSKN